MDLGRIELPTPWLQKRFNPMCNLWPALSFCDLAKDDPPYLRGFCSQSCSQIHGGEKARDHVLGFLAI